MRLGYFDCFAGASGDMILACLLDVGLKPADLIDGLAKLGVGGVDVTVEEVTRKGVRATAFSFAPQASTEPRAFKEITAAIEGSRLSPFVKEKSTTAFDILAEAESRIHGIKKDDVCFHEVGSLDSIVDVVGSFIGLEHLGFERIVCSPLALGSGYVECRHGTLPVPAPATLEIAKDLPVRGWTVAGELTTPTGAAILKACAMEFGCIPQMKVTEVGYGAGSKDLEEIPNIMRLIVGETQDYGFDRVTMVETNIDDMNPQFFSHLFDDLFSLGALDVWVENILMKKGRPGFLLTVLAEKHHVCRIVDFVLSETTTAGLRLNELERVKLGRQLIELETKYGNIRAKVFSLGSKRRCAPEYEDCLRAAKAKGVSVSEVIEETKNAFQRTLEDSP